MIDPTQEITELLRQLSNDTVAVIASRLKECADLSPVDAERLYNASMFADIDEINKLISNAKDDMRTKIKSLVDDVADDSANGYAKEYAATQKQVVAESIIGGLKTQAVQTMGGSLNLIETARFVAGPTAQVYQSAMTQAIGALSAGITDYHSAIRNTVKQLGGGLVTYQSGRTVRLDSAVAMNISDGVRQTYDNINAEHGKAFGADGWEISAHALCAKDHINIQGRQFPKDSSALAGLARPIGTRNCHHTKRPILMGISMPAYTKEELKAVNDRSNQEVTWHSAAGNEMTASRYEASQYQRKMEVTIRKKRDELKALEKSGDKEGAQIAKTDIKLLGNSYKQASDEMGLRPQWWRTGK